MNKHLANLLLVFSVALCGLCTYQWVREGRLYVKINAMNDDLYKKKDTIQSLEGTIKHHETEIRRLDGIRNDLNATIATNKQELLAMSKYTDKLEKDVENKTVQIGNYKAAIADANDKILKQNEDVKKLNEMVKTVAQQRDDKVAELNKMIEQYNKVVTDFNAFQEQVKQAHEAAAAAAAAQDQKKK